MNFDFGLKLNQEILDELIKQIMQGESELMIFAPDFSVLSSIASSVNEASLYLAKIQLKVFINKAREFSDVRGDFNIWWPGKNKLGIDRVGIIRQAMADTFAGNAGPCQHFALLVGLAMALLETVQNKIDLIEIRDLRYVKPSQQG